MKSLIKQPSRLQPETKIVDKAKVKNDTVAMEKAYQLGRDLACAIK